MSWTVFNHTARARSILKTLYCGVREQCLRAHCVHKRSIHTTIGQPEPKTPYGLDVAEPSRGRCSSSRIYRQRADLRVVWYWYVFVILQEKHIFILRSYTIWNKGVTFAVHHLSWYICRY